MEHIRTCLGCGQKYRRQDVLRIALSSEGKLVVDEKGCFFGRGGYCCPKEKCLKSFFKSRKKISRAFRREINWDQDIDTLLESGSFK